MTAIDLRENSDAEATATAAAVDHALRTVKENIAAFGDRYPADTTEADVYPRRPAQGGQPEGANVGWTTSFWPGMLWLAHDLTGDKEYLTAALSHVDSFDERVRRGIDLDTHDLGFLYTLSCVTAWRRTGDERARSAALAAADHLLTRVLEPAGIIQAWGDLNDPQQRGRTIIDSLMNTPLLFWASQVTGDDRYAAAARKHTEQLREHIIRPDKSTFHTFYWDTGTGEPLRGETEQGNADDSCWARGQAWGIYGFSLNYRYTGDGSYLRAAQRCADYFLAHLPADGVAYWDLVFSDGSKEERDSSAAAIAVCGLVELARQPAAGADAASAGTSASAGADAASAEQSASAGADAAPRHYLEVTLRDFRRAGVARDDEVRARVRALQEELVGIGQEFDRNIRSDTRTAVLPASALAGLPEDYVRAHPAGADGQVHVTTEYPDYVPFLTYATDAAAREQLWRLYQERGHPSNVDVLAAMLGRRHELATLLGYPNWAQYAAEDKMMATERNIGEFISRIADASSERCRRDYERLLARKRVDDPDAASVDPWDSVYLDDLLKAEELNFDTQAVRPYFEYGRVKAGVLGLVERLFGVHFEPRSDIPVWHPEVDCFDVRAADGELLGRIFLDMHPRPDKFNHAAMFGLTRGKAGVRVAECALVCNLPRPGADPALLLHSDVETFFHEFGHLIHYIFAGNGRWYGIAGITTEWDFVEAPSQLLEEWIRDAPTLATFAAHHETGEPLPAEMVEKLRAAEEFGKGLFVRQQMFYATVSLELYRRDPAGLDPAAVVQEAQERLTPYRFVPGTYLHLWFGHLDGYSAIYATYMWSLVIAKDLFTVFAREGLLNPETAARYRDTVLAPGGSAPAADLVRDFLGRPYQFAAYQAWLDQG